MAVTVFSFLPAAGMLGMAKDDDIYRDSENKKAFGFSNLDEVIVAARRGSKDNDEKECRRKALEGRTKMSMTRSATSRMSTIRPPERKAGRGRSTEEQRT